MNIRLLSLSILILLTVVFNDLIKAYCKSILPLKHLEGILNDYSPENLFSLGKKVSLSKLQSEDAELIPSLSYQSKEFLLKNKQQLLYQAHKLPPQKRMQVFEDIKGVGKKKALLLDQHIELK